MNVIIEQNKNMNTDKVVDDKENAINAILNSLPSKQSVPVSQTSI
jgi:hypothetical protein